MPKICSYASESDLDLQGLFCSILPFSSIFYIATVLAMVKTANINMVRLEMAAKLQSMFFRLKGPSLLVAHSQTVRCNPGVVRSWVNFTTSPEFMWV